MAEARAKAIKDYKRPVTRKGLRSFLGVVGYYRRYLHMLAKETALLSIKVGSYPCELVYKETVSAVQNICNSIAHTCKLTILLKDDTMSIVTDASGKWISAVLQVSREGKWETAAFFSCQKKGPERRYSVIELEALTLVEAVHHFAYYLHGRPFVAFTDHKQLCQLLHSDRLNRSLRIFSFKLQPWLLEIRYLPGEENSLARKARLEWMGQEDEDFGETVTDGLLSSQGGCEGPTLTEDEEGTGYSETLNTYINIHINFWSCVVS